ncbi:MAG: replicative DNA helicase, partial [Hyphomicrobiaceae bacterium]
YLQGFRGGELIVVGARTSTGKTAWLLNVARFLAFERQIPVGIYTLENSPKSVATRIVCADARLNARHVADWTQDDWDEANESTVRMAMAPIFLDGASGLTIRDIRAGVRRMVRENGIKAVFIDYLQLVAGVGKKSSDNRQSEVSEVSRGLKALAKEVDIPVIVASQLNRESEKNAGLRPKLSDLRESGSIEQDASVVLMLYRPTTDATVLEDEDIKGTCKVKMLLAKQRDGISGIDINLAFNKLHQRMDIWPKVESNDVMHTVPQPALPYSDVG